MYGPAVPEPVRSARRHALLLLAVLGPLPVLLWHGPIAQPADYHAFADRRVLLGIVNFFDVASNLAFLFAGLAGLVVLRDGRCGAASGAWRLLFVGVVLVAFGSGWYHLAPHDARLLWDRLPIAIGFAGFCAALGIEYLGIRTGRQAFWPLLAGGIAGVLIWYRTGDLRLYLWAQSLPLLAVPVLLGAFEPRFTKQWMLAAAIACYVAAKLFELGDHAVFAGSGQSISGHTLKHLAAAAGCGVLAWMLASRRPLGAGDGSTDAPR
jgi:hypothetical protein